MEAIERRIPSADGAHQLYCRLYIPEGEPKGFFHVVHGMTEHIRRYDEFMQTIAEHGYVCYGFDNLGHGYTADDDGDLGYIGKWEWMVEDMQKVTLMMKAEFGEELPRILMGHSMGSFIARCGASPKIWSKAIFMGTGGPNPASAAGLAIIRGLIRKYGERSYSSKIDDMITGKFNERFVDEHDFVSMISTIPEVREKYRQDKYCTFRFTLNAQYVLVKLQSLCNRQIWFRSVSSKLPILLLSGSEDPVGSYGKGVQAVYDNPKKYGKNVDMKLYEGYRHEVLNDVCREEVIADILNCIE